MMRVPSTAQLFGYPAIAMVLFLFAVVAGGALAAWIVLTDRKVARSTDDPTVDHRGPVADRSSSDRRDASHRRNSNVSSGDPGHHLGRGDHTVPTGHRGDQRASPGARHTHIRRDVSNATRTTPLNCRDLRGPTTMVSPRLKGAGRDLGTGARPL